MKRFSPNLIGSYCIAMSLKGIVTAQHQDRLEVHTDFGNFTLYMNESTRLITWQKNEKEVYYPVNNEMTSDLDVVGQAIFSRIVAYPRDNGSEPHLLCMELFIHGKVEDELIIMRPDFWRGRLQSLSHWWASHAIDVDKGGYYTHIREHGTIPEDEAGKDKWGYVVSRTLYAFSTAFALSGDVKSLEAATLGFRFLYEKGIIEKNGYLLFKGRMDRNGEAYPQSHDLINIFTQFYVLTGLIAYYDITRDDQAHDIIQRSLKTLLNLYYDASQGGFFDAIRMSDLRPIADKTDSKSFNSLVDPLSAVLFFLDNACFPNQVLDIRHTIEELCIIILTHCVRRNENYIREVFKRNWDYLSPNWHNPYNTHYLAGNVGGNNKVIWSFLRAFDILPEETQTKVMEAVYEIHEKMLRTGAWDKLRGGWYDVMRRNPSENGVAEHMWHTNKVWWQQESGILGYLVLYMKTGEDQFLKIAREGILFWCTNFFDHVNGGVFDTVSCDGISTNRWKGSWVKGGYHETELARFLYVYLKVVRNEPVDLYYATVQQSTDPESIPAKIPDVTWKLISRSNCSDAVQKATYGFEKK